MNSFRRNMESPNQTNHTNQHTHNRSFSTYISISFKPNHTTQRQGAGVCASCPVGTWIKERTREATHQRMEPTVDLSERDVEKKWIWKRKRLRFIAGILNIHPCDFSQLNER